MIRFLMFNLVTWEDKKMALIATIAAVGTATAAVLFFFWIGYQLFISSK